MSHKIRPLVFVFTLFLAVQPLFAQTVNPRSAGMSVERLERYTAYLQQEIDAGKAPGFVSMVYRNESLAHYEALGYSNVEAQKTMVGDDIFFILCLPHILLKQRKCCW